jgi:microcin C transport system substrate-binding protein
MIIRYLIAVIITLSITPVLAGEHGLAMFGDPKYPVGFDHLSYVNPDAPKGGILCQAAIGNFDSIHPYILKGSPAAGSQLPFETLTYQTSDEPFSIYGWIAKSITVGDDFKSVTFDIHEKAAFHDGHKIDAQDIVFSFNQLTTNGHPFYRSYYADVDRAVAVDNDTVRFEFAVTGNRELPLIMGQLPVLPQHFWADKEFDATQTDALLGSGPYRIKSVDTGRQIVFERVDDWWAADLPINRGRFNFDRIEIDYYRDASITIQALKAGEYDIRRENIAKSWATNYGSDVPAIADEMIKTIEIPHQIPTGMQAFVFNTRREKFSDPLVRQALGHVFDFEWSNKQLAFGAYTRTKSYFSNSPLASDGLPSAAELELLEPYRDQLPQAVFEKEYQPHQTDGSGRNRAGLRTAMDLFKQAGYELRDGKMVDADTGQPFTFEILEQSPSFERWVLPFIRQLNKIGVQANFRLVDSSQYQNRMDNFDFDMTVAVFPQSLSPGNEQRDFWGSEMADVAGSRNIIGIKNPVVDEFIGHITNAQTRDELVTAVKALDRVLLWHHYVIPHWHIRHFRIAHWDKFGRPDNPAPYGLNLIDTWWVDGDKAASVNAYLGQE